jgi:hypothetical protein
MGRDPVAVAEVFTLVPRDERPDRQILTPDELRWLRSDPLARLPRPAPTQPPPRGLVFRRWPDGRVTADGFPDEADVSAAVVARLDAGVVRLERDRLSVAVAGGAAVDVPVGPSPRPGGAPRGGRGMWGAAGRRVRGRRCRSGGGRHRHTWGRPRRLALAGWPRRPAPAGRRPGDKTRGRTHGGPADGRGPEHGAAPAHEESPRAGATAAPRGRPGTGGSAVTAQRRRRRTPPARTRPAPRRSQTNVNLRGSSPAEPVAPAPLACGAAPKDRSAPPAPFLIAGVIPIW